MSEPEANAGPVIKELTGKIGLDSRYEIVKPLGKGAMGMVYLAHDTKLERDVALKVMVAQIADDPELKRRFEREAKAVAKMSHPNVVAVFDLGSHTDGSPFIAMEVLKGNDLQKAMRTPPPMSLDRKIAIIVQVLQGLAHAHQAGIVHRDIKPANIFLNIDGTVKIMDFGVARLTSASMTGTGNIVGTADYMSPEQVRGAHVDGKSDLFSVGCMMFELMAGKRPFHSENLMAIFYKITHEEPNYDLIPAGDEYDALMPVIKKALSKNLEERYQTAYDYAVDLREFLKNHSTSSTGQHALEGLVDLEAPPAAGSGVDLATLIDADEDPDSDIPAGATVDISAKRAATAPTAVGRPGAKPGGTMAGATKVMGSAPTVVPGGTTIKGRTGATIPPGARKAGTSGTIVKGTASIDPTTGTVIVQQQSGPPVLYMAVGALVVGVLGLGGYIAVSKNQTETPSTVATQAPATTAPPSTAAPATTLPPPPTTVPPPTLGEVKGRQMKAAQAAFSAGDYGKAIAQAQAALAEDPGNGDARKMIDNAQKGQQALSHFKTAENALRDKDYAKALAEAKAGQDLAPWDGRGSDILGRAQQAQSAAASAENAQKAAAVAAQLNGLLAQAEAAMGSQKYDQAIGLFDEALKLDPANQRASIGRSSALAAKTLASAAGTTSGKKFVVGKTVASSAETQGGNVPAGFEATPGVDVKRGTTATEMPGKISFDVEPDSPKAGERFSVKIVMQNEGAAPIQIKDMVVNTKVNGRGISGAVPPLARDVTAGGKATLFSVADTWKEDTSSWTMEVTVRTVRGEKYVNSVTWK